MKHLDIYWYNLQYFMQRCKINKKYFSRGSPSRCVISSAEFCPQAYPFALAFLRFCYVLCQLWKVPGDREPLHENAIGSTKWWGICPQTRSPYSIRKAGLLAQYLWYNSDRSHRLVNSMVLVTACFGNLVEGYESSAAIHYIVVCVLPTYKVTYNRLRCVPLNRLILDHQGTQ